MLHILNLPKVALGKYHISPPTTIRILERQKSKETNQSVSMDFIATTTQPITVQTTKIANKHIS